MRKIHGPINEGGQYRIQTTAEHQKLYEEKHLVAFIRKGKLRWLVRVERMENKSSEADAVWQTRRKKEEKEPSVEVVR
jgi:hypothetical protein